MSDAAQWQEMAVNFRVEPDPTIGLIALSNDSTIQPDMTRFLGGAPARLQTHRIPSPHYLDVSTLNALKDSIGATAANLLPTNRMDVVAFGCTSAAMALGPDVIAAEIRRVHPGVAVTDPVSAALKGLARLGCGRVALLTPYIGEVNTLVAEYLECAGLTLVSRGNFPVRDNDQRSYIAPNAFRAAAAQLMADKRADALFISCTAMMTSGILESLEQELGRPVVASNQALAWDALRLARCTYTPNKRGRLMYL